MTQHGRAALVTGGGSGIGKATSLRLARAGRSVGVLGLDQNTVAVAQAITAAGGTAFAVQADVSDRAQVGAGSSICPRWVLRPGRRIWLLIPQPRVALLP